MIKTTAKTIDADDTRAITLIGIYAFYTGCFMLLGVATPILRLRIYSQGGELIITAVAIALLGWILSGHWSKSVTRSCYYNLAISYSPPMQVAIAIFWISLLLIFSWDLNQVIRDGLISGMWAIAATTLLGVALRLGMTTELGNFKNIASNPIAAQVTNAKITSVQITIREQSDRDQIIISPNTLAQQPRQFKALMSLALSLFTYTILDLPEGIAEFTAIALASFGLTGLSTWQVLLCPSKRSISLNFSGIWGMASSFTINLLQFSRLETIKLKEIDMQWLQLAGNSSTITLPISVSEVQKSPKQLESNLGDSLVKILIDRLNLAEHKISRDILGVMNIILPQSVSTLAGIVILGMGIGFLAFLPLPAPMPLETYILFSGTCLVSPSIARLIMAMVAPSNMIPDSAPQALSPWQIGTALILIATFSGSQFPPNQGESILTLAVIWLCFGVGSCILALSRRSPLITKRF